MNEHDRKETEAMIKESLTACSRRCLTLPWFIGTMIVIVGMMFTALAFVYDRKLDAKTFDQFREMDITEKKSMEKYTCQITQTLNLMYNKVYKDGPQRPVPDCDTSLFK